MSQEPPTLGSLLRNLRKREGWTLKEMSAKSGIPVSTLSKIEHDRLTLTYDKLQSLGQRLGLRMSDLFSEQDETASQAVTARRSLGDIGRSVRVETPNYDYYYLCTELRRKRMIPVITKIRARSAEQFGDLVRHSGEEFIYVLSGKVVVQTEFYDPVTLEAGQSLYIDSSMGHAYLAAEDCEEAEVLGIMSSADEALMESMLNLHEEQRQATTPANEDTPSDEHTRTARGAR
ncbi:cupin domain-containing protein [Erythrobacter sp. LQ02-29]|uniref:helix-turn-helix domain-containing protein n=1 Tax=unclassified Erythrobacter TaxID=2633097 RepID=UPI001BFC27B7|nr:MULTISPECIES: cupin domain-containing protein [unclassified Erythrobacter]MCP9222631.1 cupin domain-containing protein [Erythrobacter sp. LQ02-29]QWC56113.1 cupin domain-containing protein [Erythrobacter sp. 3-20A1M]